ncbi:ATP-dependent helicase HrpA [Desulfosarcina sp. BuS5]|uniref:ATP-dependent RNA helicase HrpA n=1 Tax=Desulfosarcina sp. BuS5 TaxID=933262 RepID=UPI000688D32B|nr:ATP-dependent RNA helicase HrpA [Desulfosarcina sp. BuS5]WDN88337.1 ATP-dependent helicase HrpA [Desulfosarcina sp. BuS5]
MLNPLYDIKKIERLLADAMPADSSKARRRLNNIRRFNEKKIQTELAGIRKLLKASIKKKWRRDNLPQPLFNRDLPVFPKKNEIIEAISKNRIIIISGETGSGKTTQIPQFCLAAGRGINGLIGCTQPRRIAAITVAGRIAEELGEPAAGGLVGYKIRFKDKTDDNSFIKIMTDGILLAETRRDPFLNKYDTLIIDEAHERSLNIDFVLGFLKTLLKKRKDLKLIITSATIDTEKFSKAFDNAPVIEVSGRMYPVEVRYFSDKHDQVDDITHVEMAALAVDELQRKCPFGDLLVFMPTEHDIHEARRIIEGRKYKGVVVLPLYARLPAAEQKKIFRRGAGRKIIIATNIAETSITIPGVKYVIDTGLARISHYMPGSRITSLPVVPVSQSSAEQRKGRCGRVENGICIRLFSEQDFNSRPIYTPPEILRTNLAEVILRMMALNLGDIEKFPFIDRPASKSIKDGFNLLAELGAIVPLQTRGKAKKNRFGPEEARVNSSSGSFRLTKYGRLMANIPLDPRLARILIEAAKFGCLDEMAVIASALSIQDPRERPPDKAEEADKKHKEFIDPLSDFITLLNIWKMYNKTWKKVKTGNRIKKFCREYFLSYKRMREWIDIHYQLTDIINEYKRNKKSGAELSKTVSKSADNDWHPLYVEIHKAVLSGFLSNIALKKEKNIYQAAKGREVMIFPGSGLFNRAGQWTVFAELIETSRLYARKAANIDNAWLEEAGKKQCKYTYNQPHWERNRGEVVAFEQVSLYGLIIVSQRPVSYGRIDPGEAARIFIESALVQGDVKKVLPFMQHNLELIEKAADMENKFRRRDILASEEDMFNFYINRLAGIYDIRSLERLIKKKGDDGFLRMEMSDLIINEPDTEELALYPDNIPLGNREFQCAYNFKIGDPDDGVTIKVPSTLTAGIPIDSIDWLVPGLFKEKISALIKSLPKKHRKKLVPVADTVDMILNEMPHGQGSLFSALSSFIYKRFTIDIPASAWNDDALPDHLKAVIAITDENGKEIRSGRDKALLYEKVQQRGKEKESKELVSLKKIWERRGITKWDFPDLPQSISINNSNGKKWAVYPGLEVDEAGNSKKINLHIFRNAEAALESHKKGVAALLSGFFSNDLKFLKKRIKIPEKLQQSAKHFGGTGRINNKLYQSVTGKLFEKNIRSKKEFHSYTESIGPLILKKGDELLKQSLPVMSVYNDTLLNLAELEKRQRFNKKYLLFLKELREEMERLVPENFMELYETARLVHIIRYIKAFSIRGERALVNLEKDKTKAGLVNEYRERLNSFLQGLSPGTTKEKRTKIEEFFWLIEEYKVSVFAQELKTIVPVSRKRLDKMIREIERMV